MFSVTGSYSIDLASLQNPAVSRKFYEFLAERYPLSADSNGTHRALYIIHENKIPLLSLQTREYSLNIEYDKTQQSVQFLKIVAYHAAVEKWLTDELLRCVYEEAYPGNDESAIVVEKSIEQDLCDKLQPKLSSYLAQHPSDEPLLQCVLGSIVQELRRQLDERGAEPTAFREFCKLKEWIAEPDSALTERVEFNQWLSHYIVQTQNFQQQPFTFLQAMFETDLAIQPYWDLLVALSETSSRLSLGLPEITNLFQRSTIQERQQALRILYWQIFPVAMRLPEPIQQQLQSLQSVLQNLPDPSALSHALLNSHIPEQFAYWQHWLAEQLEVKSQLDRIEALLSKFERQYAGDTELSRYLQRLRTQLHVLMPSDEMIDLSVLHQILRDWLSEGLSKRSKYASIVGLHQKSIVKQLSVVIDNPIIVEEENEAAPAILDSKRDSGCFAEDANVSTDSAMALSERPPVSVFYQPTAASPSGCAFVPDQAVIEDTVTHVIEPVAQRTDSREAISLAVLCFFTEGPQWLKDQLNKTQNMDEAITIFSQAINQVSSEASAALTAIVNTPDGAESTVVEDKIKSLQQLLQTTSQEPVTGITALWREGHLMEKAAPQKHTLNAWRDQERTLWPDNPLIAAELI